MAEDLVIERMVHLLGLNFPPSTYPNFQGIQISLQCKLVFKAANFPLHQTVIGKQPDPAINTLWQVVNI